MNQEKRYMVIQMFPFVCKHVKSNLTVFLSFYVCLKL